MKSISVDLADAPGFPPRLARLALVAAVACASIAALAAVVAGGNAAFALLPFALCLGGWMLAKLPLRLSAGALLFTLLAIEDSVEWCGQWRSPLAVVGNLLHDNIDRAIPIPGLAFTGMELLIVLLLVVHAYRSARGGTPAAAEPVAEPASILRDLLVVYLAAVVFAEALGLSRGLPVVPWKLRNLLQPVLLAVVFVAAFRTPREYRMVGGLVIAAATAKALQVLVVQADARALHGGNWDTATSHGDSVPFAVAMLLLILAVLEQPRWRNVVAAAMLLPIIGAGAYENERRLVWVMVALGLLFVFVVSPPTPWKRLVTRSVLFGAPILALYVGIGWNSGHRIFAPVQTMRSVSDTKSDRSAYWREVETWNVSTTIRDHMLLGTGLGGEYVETMMNDDISTSYKEYREWPHNTVLGLLMLMGVFGFTAVWMPYPLAVFLAVRSYRHARTSDERLAALGCVGTIASCLVMAWGDTGLHYPQHKIFFALTLAVVSRLSVVTGAWPARRARALPQFS